MKASQLASMLLKILPTGRQRARRRAAGVCARVRDSADERLELVAAVGQDALRRPAGIRPAEFQVLVHVVAEQ